jgi:protein-S-isoprenylcysteine O-methyltransferase Ste14
MTGNDKEQDTKGTKRLFWTASAFYALIAFEFFYMASPFAAYFYSVYGPGMDWLQALPIADWTLWFILPHLVEDTRSTVLNYVELFGIALLFGGLLAFAVGAFQVYRAKLTKSGAVTGGVYRYIRHPQYAALIIASLGMLLVWPRFLVLFSTAGVILA